MRRRGFTLLELLVVIGIIGILVGILAPALGKMWRRAAEVACQSNISALVKANLSYASENDDSFVIAAEDHGDNMKRWFGTREDADSAFTSAEGTLVEHLPGLKLSTCPSFKGASETAGQDAAFEAGCGAYGYNDLYIGGSFGSYKDRRAMVKDGQAKGYNQSARLEDVADMGGTVMFADAAYFKSGGLIAYSFTHAPQWVPKAYSPPNPSIHFRHDGKAAIGWADGHASTEEMTYSVEYTDTGAGGTPTEDIEDMELGWFGKQHDSLPDANYLFDLN